MKNILLAFSLLFVVVAKGQTVTFWTEDFGFGCNGGTFADNYFSFMTGTWTVTSTGYNASVANEWFISAEENGNAAGNCGTACGNDQSLHLGALNSFLGTDLGAAYYEGLDGFCDLIDCGATDKRAESPVINCSGIANISIQFNYIEGGNTLDNATLWYYDGAAWSLLMDIPKSPICGNGQGQWTQFSTALPFSSNNNTDVKIGFRWQNNDDGDATDPSFAVDDIELIGDFATDVVPPVVTCPANEVIFTEEFCAMVEDYVIQTVAIDDVDPFPVITQSPEVGTPLVPGDYDILITATDNSGNSSSCIFTLTVIDDDAPELECPVNVTVQVATGETSGSATVALPDVFDNCGSYSWTNDFNGNEDASDVYPLGVTDVTFTATDDSGNESSCTATVTVIETTQECCLGDFNCDGFISVVDMLILLTDFSNVGSGLITDLDNDDIVGVNDMQIFMGLYGTNCP